MPQTPTLAMITEQQFAQLSTPICQHILDKTNEPASVITLSRFLSGLHTPLFTRIKARSVSGFARLENYPFAQVKQWAQAYLVDK